MLKLIVGVAEGQSSQQRQVMEASTRGYCEEEDFYKLLGCRETSTTEQISTEFKLLAREHHPDKVANPDKKEAAEKRFLVLKRARDVLVDGEARRLYDQWRSGFRHWISFQDWLKMQGRVHASIHWGGGARRVASLEPHRGGECMERVEREEGEREPSPALLQFRNSGSGGSRLSKFRNYQL